MKIEQSLGVPSNHQLLVHQVDDNQSPINLSSLQQHQFQQHIISIRPDHVSTIATVLCSYIKQKHLECKKMRGQSEAAYKQADVTKSFDIS